MSGVVGPTGSDIQLPKEEHEHGSFDKTPIRRPQQGGFLSFRQLNALALIIIFSASGMVSLEDFAFVFFSFFYVYFMSKVAFPPHPNPTSEPPIFGNNTKILGIYVFIGAVIGLFAPIAYIFHGIVEGDKHGIKAATPHVYLLASQVFMEGLAYSGRFSIPIRVFVPVWYNARRIFTIIDWLRSEVYKADEQYGGSERRLHIGRGLAIANMVFWSFNLFGFLFPVYLPRAFKVYYKGLNLKD